MQCTTPTEPEQGKTCDLFLYHRGTATAPKVPQNEKRKELESPKIPRKEAFSELSISSLCVVLELRGGGGGTILVPTWDWGGLGVNPRFRTQGHTK
eukprot:1337931-Amphidinium_carterae.1